MRKYVIIFMLFCVGFVSCSDGSDDNTAFTITEQGMGLTAVGGTMTVTLSIEGDRVTSDQSWCVPNVSGRIVALTLEPNSRLEGRTALVTVTKGAEKVVFPVTQPGNLVPTIMADGVAFDAHGGIEEVFVKNALPFKVVLEEGVSWLTARVDGSTLVLTAQTNYTRSELKTTVKLVSEGLESEFVVTQSGIILTPDVTSLVMYNAGDEAKVLVNSTLPFEATSNQSWLTITPGDGFVTLMASDNSGRSARTAIVTLTSETLTATINVTQRPTAYSDYLGNWVLTGYDDGQPFTYNLSITKSTDGSTYKVAGWGKSEIATDSKYALEAVFDEATQYIYITQQMDLGIYTDESGDYDVMFRGLVKVGSSLSFVNGSFVCYIGALQRDGTVQWSNNILTIGGQRYELAGSLYCIQSHDDGGIYNFNADEPFMYSPTMKKTSAIPYTRGVIKSKMVKRVAISQLQIQK